MTLESFCKTYGFNLATAVNNLKKKGLNFNKDMTFKQIANDNSTSPIDIYEKLKPL